MKIIISILFLFGSFSGSAQTWSEWFKQKKTQIKYLTQQIAALQIYIGYARKGYEIADKGLTAIGDIKNGEFNLYRDFFSSLREVNSNLYTYSRREGIILSQKGIIKLYQRTIAEMISSGQFTNIEIDQTRARFLSIIEQSVNFTNELVVLTSDGYYELNDNQRLKRIEAIQKEILSLVILGQDLAGSNLLLSKQRVRDQKEVRKSKKLYGY